MTPEQTMDTNKNVKCDGSCESHTGSVQKVHVKGWGYFNYCSSAIEEDTKRGLQIEVQSSKNNKDSK